MRDFTHEFLESKSSDPNGPSYSDLTSGPQSVLHEAQRILGRCLPPTESGAPETGLVVGYVQSGKTLSFETVIALARDNGYGIVIVLAGTKNNLLDQSEKRLRKDFQIDHGSEHWYHLHNPTSAVRDQIESRLNAWRKRAEKKSVLITLLKHGGHIEKLAIVLRNVDLNGAPSLIIDDESDQASLNTKAARIKAGLAAVTDVSTTYKSILQLRAVLPHHSYLQYTATPQAMLLLAQTDFLNPNFAELVTPGETYTGGKEFFKGAHKLVEDIPPAQVPTNAAPLTSVPATLLKAYRSFLLAASHHSLTRARGAKQKDRNRSMMIHPALATSSHKTYKKWIDQAHRSLRVTLETAYASDPKTAEGLFKSEYESLKATFPEIRPLSELIGELVDDVFDELNVVEINDTKDAEKHIDWQGTRYWILVGAAKLDRGYTVEGLCTTYMPRGLGGPSAAADTLQQRARFFGYKAAFLGLCRVFVQPLVREAFTEYLEHEEFVRDALGSNRGKPLSSWRRDFILTDLLKPTRANVIGLGVRRIGVRSWLVPGVMQRDDAAAASNRVLLNEVVRKWAQNFGKPVNAATILKGATNSPNDVIEGVPLRVVLEDFLLDVQVRDPEDAEQHTAALIGLSAALRKDSSLKVEVFLMNRLHAGYRTREAGRGLTATHRFAPINQYFSQSAGSINDRDHCFSDRISLQLRIFDLGIHQRDQSRADIKDVVWFALHVPQNLQKTLVIEKQE